MQTLSDALRYTPDPAADARARHLLTLLLALCGLSPLLAKVLPLL